MFSNRIVEYVFFFGLMAIVGYLVWKIVAPFVTALALAAIIVTICYPLYERVRNRTPHRNETVAALFTTFLVLLIVILPITLLTSAIVTEALSVYRSLNNETFALQHSLIEFQNTVQLYFPSFELNLDNILRQVAAWLAGNLAAIFAGTASTIFLFFIAMVGSFYFFRDGHQFTKRLVEISPLPDDQDDQIIARLAQAIRSVATGTLLVALLQGMLSAIGLAVTGFDQAILFGGVAAIGALIPGVGVMIVFAPALIYLLVLGDYTMAAVLIAFWIPSGLIDNIVGPYLMGRGNPMHPFLLLVAVLGGIAAFGPLGFIVGPVIVSFFLVLLELYTHHIGQKNITPSLYD